MDQKYNQYSESLFKAAELCARHFTAIGGDDINEYAKQKAHQFEVLVKLFFSAEHSEAFNALEETKFAAYRVDMKIDEWD